MIVDWFSPLPPARTGIANYAMDVIPALARIAAVRIWSASAFDESCVSSLGEVIHYRYPEVPWRTLNSGDIAIYNLGNNVEFHRDIYKVSTEYPGVVILHETCLQDFFWGFYTNEENQLAWLSEMDRTYGDPARLMAESFLAGGCSLQAIGTKYPLTEPATRNALAVAMHASAFDGAKNPPQPFASLPLPYSSEQQPRRMLHKSEGLQAGRAVQLIAFGHLGRNRGLESIVEALAGLCNPAAFHLDIFGSIAGQKELRAVIAGKGLAGVIDLHGFVSTEELNSALDRAEVAINLRTPTMGESSLTQLQIWSYALPSLVSQTGWYASLPGDTVAFVRPGREIEDIQAHLERYRANPDQFAAMGWRGYATLLEKHRPEQYAADLLHLAEAAKGFRPSLAAYQLSERVGWHLADTFGDTVDNSQVDSMVERISGFAG